MKFHNTQGYPNINGHAHQCDARLQLWQLGNAPHELFDTASYFNTRARIPNSHTRHNSLYKRRRVRGQVNEKEVHDCELSTRT